MISFHYNGLADGKIEEQYVHSTETKKSWRYRFDNLRYKGTYCVRRCGFYKGNFSIELKEELKRIKEYDDMIGCNGIPWVAFEGSYSECKEFRKQNQTYFHYDY